MSRAADGAATLNKRFEVEQSVGEKARPINA
jgi:hypothetical protein